VRELEGSAQSHCIVVIQPCMLSASYAYNTTVAYSVVLPVLLIRSHRFMNTTAAAAVYIEVAVEVAVTDPLLTLLLLLSLPLLLLQSKRPVGRL
jgi:hypothetical protein